MSVKVVVDVDLGDGQRPWDRHVFWVDSRSLGGVLTIPAKGFGEVYDCDRRVRLVSAHPATLRAVAQGLLAAADELDHLYVEHGAEPTAEQQETQ